MYSTLSDFEFLIMFMSIHNFNFFTNSFRRKMIPKIDKDGDGLVTVPELSAYIKHANEISAQQTAKIRWEMMHKSEADSIVSMSWEKYAELNPDEGFLFLSFL